jgi:hypothetical protein
MIAMKRKIICLALALCVAAQAMAKDAAPGCGELAKAVPDKIGDLAIVKKVCDVVTPEVAKALHVAPGARYLEADYEQKSPKRYINISVSIGQPGQPTAKDFAANVAGEKDAAANLQRAAASGNAQWVKSYEDHQQHVRIAPLSQPEEALLAWHEGPDANAEVHGVVNETAFVTLTMSATDIDNASATLNQINSAMKYALLH